MSDTGGSEQVLPPQAPWRPLWWWFLLHGILVGAWGLFALVSPARGPEGWVLDGIAYGVMLVLAGTQLVVQGLGWRRYGRGWLAMLVAGVLAIATAFACFAAGAARSADAMFWIVIVFLALEGTVFVVGTLRGALFRAWGLLMGGVIYAALVLLAVLRFTIDIGYELLDPVWGALGLLYGIAMITAAIQVRHAGIAHSPKP